MKTLRNCLVLMTVALNLLYAADPLAIPANRTIELDRIQHLEQKLDSLSQKITTQKAELKLLKNSLSGDLDTDARLIIKNMTEVGDDFEFREARYYLDEHEVALITNENSKNPVVFDNFVKEGPHVVRIEKKYSPNNKIFTYMNEQKYALSGKTNVVLKPGNATYLDVTSFQTPQKKDPLDLKYQVKTVPHASSGRSILPVSEMPHLLPGSKATATSLVIFAGRELEPNFKLTSAELVLDGKRLKNAATGTEGPSGWILFDGAASPGSHKLEATLRFEGVGKPAITSRFKTEITTEPGFKTSVILTHNKKVRMNQEAL